MVLADGVIDARELEALYKIGLEQYNLTQEEIISVVRDAGSSFTFPTDLRGKVRILFNLSTIALADGTVDKEEFDLLKKYIIRMGFEEQNADGIANYLLDSVRENKAFEEIMESINQ